MGGRFRITSRWEVCRGGWGRQPELVVNGRGPVTGVGAVRSRRTGTLGVRALPSPEPPGLVGNGFQDLNPRAVDVQSRPPRGFARVGCGARETYSWPRRGVDAGPRKPRSPSTASGGGLEGRSGRVLSYAGRPGSSEWLAVVAHRVVAPPARRVHLPVLPPQERRVGRAVVQDVALGAAHLEQPALVLRVPLVVYPLSLPVEPRQVARRRPFDSSIRGRGRAPAPASRVRAWTANAAGGGPAGAP